MLYRKLGGTEFSWKRPPYEYEYELLPFDILCGTDRIRLELEAEADLSQIEEGWKAELKGFEGVREGYLLYSPGE
jgi:uncharacterized protein YbbC (DUF1343 family)